MVTDFIEKAKKRQEGILPQPDKDLTERLTRLDYQTISDATGSYDFGYINPTTRVNMQKIFERWQNGKLMDERVEKAERGILGYDFKPILDSFIDVRGVFIPSSKSFSPINLSRSEDTYVFCMCVYGKMEVRNSIDDYLISRLVLSFGTLPATIRDANVFQKLIPEYRRLTEYIAQGDICIMNTENESTYALVGTAKKTATSVGDINKRILAVLGNPDLFTALDIHGISERSRISPFELVDGLIELLKSGKIISRFQDNNLLFDAAGRTNSGIDGWPRM